MSNSCGLTRTPHTRTAAVNDRVFRLLEGRIPPSIELLNLDADDPDLHGVDFLVPGYGFRERRSELADLQRLSVLHVSSAGTDWIEDYLSSRVTLTNARGARDAPVAEWILAALLGVTSGVLRGARARTWEHEPLIDLGSWTILVVGMGSIGRRLEALAAPLGPRIIGVASRAREDLHGIDALPTLLPDADAVVLLTPLTDTTRHLIGAAELDLLQDGALVINAARGGVLDTDALTDELQRDRLRAVLDVTDPEPLPDGHPLWSAPGLLSITPHLAGDSAAGHQAAAELAAEQVLRWARGDALINVVRPGSA